MRLSSQPSAQLRIGTVGAYMATRDVEAVRQVRLIAGRVTVSGRDGMRIISALARAGDLHDVDLDPAGYRPTRSDKPALFAEDWAYQQRSLGLPVVRSQGRYVDPDNLDTLREAFTEPLPLDVVRVVSLHERWPRPEQLPSVTDAAQAADNNLALVFASVMDPFKTAGATHSLMTLAESVRAGGRQVELLRTDLTGIAFAANGGSLGSIGVSTSTRHHGLPMPINQKGQYAERGRWPLVFVPSLASWQRGSSLGALAEFDGAGIAECSCTHCDGRNLLRFDREWPKQIPADVREDARAHDLAAWSHLAERILLDPQPWLAWTRTCAAALATAATIEATHKVPFELPRTIRTWGQGR